jgi:hypothetical protein
MVARFAAAPDHLYIQSTAGTQKVILHRLEAAVDELWSFVGSTWIDKEAGWWALKNMRHDHLGFLAIGDVQLTADAYKQSLLFARSPDETRYHAGQDD